MSALIADLQAKGLVSSRDLAVSLAAFGGRPGSVADRADLDHAIMILAGMTDSIDAT